MSDEYVQDAVAVVIVIVVRHPGTVLAENFWGLPCNVSTVERQKTYRWQNWGPDKIISPVGD